MTGLGNRSDRISTRIANRRARAIQRGYLQGVPRGYKQILVPAELVGGIKLTLKGKQLHEELNAANGACTHFLSQAIWDAYRKGIISVSQRRTLLLVNKAANSAKHQSSMHGHVGNVVDKQELSLADLLDGPADSRLFSLQSAAFNVLYGDFPVDAASRGISMEAPSSVAHAGVEVSTDLHDNVPVDDKKKELTEAPVKDSLLAGSDLHEDETWHDDLGLAATDVTVENNFDLLHDLLHKVDDEKKALAEESANGSLLAGSDGQEVDDVGNFVSSEALTEHLVQDSLLVCSALHEDETLHEALTEDSVQDSLLAGSVLHEDATLHDDHTPTVTDFTVENNHSVLDSLLAGSVLHEDATLHDDHRPAVTDFTVENNLLHDGTCGSRFLVDACDDEALAAEAVLQVHEATARWADVFSSASEDEDFMDPSAVHGKSHSVIPPIDMHGWHLVRGIWSKTPAPAEDSAQWSGCGQRELTCSPDPTGDEIGDDSTLLGDTGWQRTSIEVQDTCVVDVTPQPHKEPLVPVFVPMEHVANQIQGSLTGTFTRPVIDTAYLKAARGYDGEWIRTLFQKLQHANKRADDLHRRLIDEIRYTASLKRDKKNLSEESFNQWTDGFKSSFHEHLLALKDAHRQELEDLKVAQLEKEEQIVALRAQIANLKQLNSKLVNRLSKAEDLQEACAQEHHKAALHEHENDVCCEAEVDSDSNLHDSCSEFGVLYDSVLHDCIFSDGQLHDCVMHDLKQSVDGSGHAGSPQRWGHAGRGKRKNRKQGGNSSFFDLAGIAACHGAQLRMKRYSFKANGITEPDAVEDLALSH